MTIATDHSNQTDVSNEDYLVVGLAVCFIKDEDGVHQVQVIEPIPSAALEAIIKGIPTSYRLASGTTLGSVLVEPLQLSEFPDDAQLCDEFAFRALAATRTYKSRPTAQSYIPLGATRQDFNFSLERKRVLNSERIVKTEDNVKQHAHTHKVL